MTPDPLDEVSRLYHAALERPPAERAAFLNEACISDDALRQEVESLLGHEAASERFIERPAAEILTAVRAPVGAQMLNRQLGPYKIVALLGAGGMGDVYRARDTKLGRDVAIKVLPLAFMTDPERRARFTREAHLLAALNHPHIAAIYGLEEAENLTALVLELVEGPTLAERLERGPMPLPDALAIARQIAEALDSAHEKGIVHRDLKPANIVLQSATNAAGVPSGDVRAKVLDFGLAKALMVPGSSPAPPTEGQSSAGTASGRVLGTPAYMSPEQTRGEAVDKRTDIWAFGCVLYEMLAGRRAFDGNTMSDTFVSILEREPDWTALPVGTPASVQRLFQRCLRKDPQKRLHDIADARIELDETEPAIQSAVAGNVRRRSLERLGWITAALLAVALVGVVSVVVMQFRRPLEPPGPVVSTLVSTSAFVAGLSPGSPGVHFAVAPSGRTVVLSGNYGSSQALYRRDLDRVDPEPIGGTEGGSDVFFSPDSRRLGFEKGSALWTVSLDGGTPQRLLSNQSLRGGTWAEGDKIVVGRVGSGLWMASTTGGEPRQLTVPEQGERHELPQMLPGGRAVLFTILPIDKPPRAAVHLVGTGETRSLFEGIGARFVGSGYVAFGRQERLWAVRFDPDSLQTLGAAYPVRDDVLWSAAGYPQFSVDAGLLAYVRTSQASGKPGNSVPTWVDRQGRKAPLPIKANNFMLPRLSPTGDRFVVQIGANRDLWTYDLRRATLTRLTSDRIIAYSAPAWASDGKRVAFATWFDNDVGLGWVHSDGSGRIEELIKGIGMRSVGRTHPVILPDGSGVIMTGLVPGSTVEDLLFVPLAGDRRLEPVFQAPGVERNPAIAPSGRFLAYNSDESGTSEVYVRPFPNAGSRKWQVSTDGGGGPVWTRDGSEIVYRDRQGGMMSVAVRSDGNEPVFSKAELLFRVGSGGYSGLDRGWDVSADGARFLFLVSNRVTEGSEGVLELILIQNWADELKRLASKEYR